jgi:hypothetical protein
LALAIACRSLYFLGVHVPIGVPIEGKGPRGRNPWPTCIHGDLSMAKHYSVLGIYLRRSELESGATALEDAGFSISDVSVLVPEDLGSKDLATEKNTKAPEGAAVGAGSGAAVGGALGWLAGVGALAIPGIGPVIAAGPLVAALAGIGVGGALGGFTGALIGVGIPEYEAKRYEGKLQKGAILVVVHCDMSDQIKRAREILEITGAEDIASSGEASAEKKTAA